MPRVLRNVFLRFHKHPEPLPLAKPPSSTPAEMYAMRDEIGWTTDSDNTGSW